MLFEFKFFDQFLFLDESSNLFRGQIELVDLAADSVDVHHVIAVISVGLGIQNVEKVFILFENRR